MKKGFSFSFLLPDGLPCPLRYLATQAGRQPTVPESSCSAHIGLRWLSLWARRYLNLTLISHFVGFLAIPSLCVFGCNSCSMDGQLCFISWLFLAQLLFFYCLRQHRISPLGSSSCRWASTWILKVSRMAPLPGPLRFKRTHAFSAQADTGGSEQSQTGNSSAQNAQHSPAYLA